jgi:hypothetical protein
MVPKGSIRIKPRGINAEIYLSQSARGYIAMAFSGNRGQYDFYGIYNTIEKRDAQLARYLDDLKKTAEARAKRNAERNGYRHDYKEGEILHYSWGYEQTQCEFYQVIATTEKTITLRQIASQTVPGSEGMDSDHRTGLKHHFLKDAKPMIKRVGTGGYVSMEYGCARRWDGTPRFCSWY